MVRISKAIQSFAVFAAGLLAGVGILTWIEFGTSKSPIKGDSTTAGKLAGACSAVGSNSSADTALCLGFVSGVLSSSPDIRRLCLPVNWSVGSAQRLFLAWAKRHPDELGLSASEGVVRAHRDSFVCRGKEQESGI
jgi:hypothetical protein